MLRIVSVRILMREDTSSTCLALATDSEESEEESKEAVVSNSKEISRLDASEDGRGAKQISIDLVEVVDGWDMTNGNGSPVDEGTKASLEISSPVAKSRAKMSKDAEEPGACTLPLISPPAGMLLSTKHRGGVSSLCKSMCGCI